PGGQGEQDDDLWTAQRSGHPPHGNLPGTSWLTRNDGVAWYLPQGGPSMASPVLYEGYRYVLEQRGGLLSCYGAKTGKQVYKERLPGAQGFTSSPAVAGGALFWRTVEQLYRIKP